jgi:hypothetical protein
MSLIGNGISSVRAYILPVAVATDGEAVVSPRWAVVHWASPYENMFYQVYTAKRFAGVTISSSQRRLLVPVPDCHISAIPIEVFAVAPQNAHIDFSSQLTQDYCSGVRAQLRILRSQSLPTGGTLQIYSDGGTGQIDYDNPLNDPPIPLWPAWQKKSGLGMSRFGYSDFGWDGSACVGHGSGCFAVGQFGYDGDAVIWQSEPLDAGLYRFAVVVVDAEGNKSEPCISEAVVIVPPALPPARIEMAAYQQTNNQLIFEVL